VADITDKKVWSTRNVLIAIAITASVVFSATMIWNRFLAVEQFKDTVKSEFKKAASDRGELWRQIDNLKKK